MKMNPLDKYQNMIPHFTHVVHRVCLPSWQLTNPAMEKFNFMLIYDGEASLVCNGKKYAVSKGQLLFFKPRDTRFARTSSTDTMKCYAVDFTYTCPFFDGEKWAFEMPTLPFDTVEYIRDPVLLTRLINLFDELTRIWLLGSNKKVIRARSVFSEILFLLLEWKNSSKELNYDKIRKAEKVLQYMGTHYHEKLTLKHLADQVSISAPYLSSIFREVIGKPPIEKLIEIRINRAKELLLDGFTLSDVITQVGYNDVFYFCRSFKNVEGISPKQWLKSQKE
jgi:AraC-like DNA-binding protein